MNTIKSAENPFIKGPGNGFKGCFPPLYFMTNIQASGSTPSDRISIKTYW